MIIYLHHVNFTCEYYIQYNKCPVLCNTPVSMYDLFTNYYNRSTSRPPQYHIQYLYDNHMRYDIDNIDI